MRLAEGQTLTGSSFNEPVCVETVIHQTLDHWTIGLVGLKSELFRLVAVTSADFQTLTISNPGFFDNPLQIIGPIENIAVPTPSFPVGGT
jgi:hypothetical protein